MLNRVVESFYWIGRYTERIDYTARLMDVTLYAHHNHLGKETNRNDLQERFSTILSDVASEQVNDMCLNVNKILEYVTIDQENINSIFNSLNQARFNVRVVRQQTSAKMWDTINSFYLWLLEQKQKKDLEQSPFLFLERVRNEVSLFNGVTDSSMLHEVEWRFLQAGKLLERTENTVRIIQKLFLSLEEENSNESDYAYYHLNSVLESVDGFEAFRKFHANQVELETVIEFLVLNTVFPRSISFSLSELERYLKEIQVEHQLEHITKVIRLVKRQRVLLFNCLGNKEKPMHRAFLTELLASCNHIGQELEKCFFMIEGRKS